jgi:hypothetical protein
MKTENELAVVNESGFVVDNNNNDGLIDYINNYGNELHDNYISGMLYVAQELQNNPVFEEQLLWKIIVFYLIVGILCVLFALPTLGMV